MRALTSDGTRDLLDQAPVVHDMGLGQYIELDLADDLCACFYNGAHGGWIWRTDNSTDFGTSSGYARILAIARKPRWGVESQLLRLQGPIMTQKNQLSLKTQNHVHSSTRIAQLQLSFEDLERYYRLPLYAHPVAVNAQRDF
jgi:hypothetical protein